MFIHSKLGYSTVNGPGERAVVWVQGCVGMNCPGCWNPKTHLPFIGEQLEPGSLVSWIADQPGITGVTFSGGEPMQQAFPLMSAVIALKKLRPGISVGMFTGYSESELDSGNYRTYLPLAPREVKDLGVRQLIWQALRSHLDFAIMGRYNQLKPTNSQLRSSENQKLRLFSDRYTEADFAGPLEVEVTIDDELIQVTGFPTKGLEL